MSKVLLSAFLLAVVAGACGERTVPGSGGAPATAAPAGAGGSPAPSTGPSKPYQDYGY